MLKVRDQLLKELRAWLEESEVETVGHGFLRLHVVDMDGPMDVEAGFFTKKPYDGDGRVRSGFMPAGDYATLTFRDHARRANGTLIDWANDQGIEFDHRRVPEGEAFGCRYEANLTDPRDEPRKTKWAVELGIRIAHK